MAFENRADGKARLAFEYLETTDNLILVFGCLDVAAFNKRIRESAADPQHIFPGQRQTHGQAGIARPKKTVAELKTESDVPKAVAYLADRGSLSR